MHLDHYDVLKHKGEHRFSFFSKGPKGVIRKDIHFQHIEEMAFNLVFGDWREDLQQINDRGRINNGDGRKILATVGITMLGFLRQHPEATVFVEGNTEAKKRLYQMAAGYLMKQVGYLVEVEGFYNQQWDFFQQAKKYEAFIVRAKRKE